MIAKQREPFATLQCADVQFHDPRPGPNGALWIPFRFLNTRRTTGTRPMSAGPAPAARPGGLPALPLVSHSGKVPIPDICFRAQFGLPELAHPSRHPPAFGTARIASVAALRSAAAAFSGSLVRARRGAVVHAIATSPVLTAETACALLHKALPRRRPAQLRGGLRGNVLSCRGAGGRSGVQDHSAGPGIIESNE